MKRFLLAFVLLFSGIAAAQQTNFPYPYPIGIIGKFSVATLPTTGLNNPTLAYVGDSNAGSCTSGGSSSLQLCQWNGSAWSAVGGSGSTYVPSQAINLQTTTYSVVDGDRAKLIVLNGSSGFAVTLPQANGSTFVSGWYTNFVNTGTGTVTLSITTSTISGVSTVFVPPGAAFSVTSDGTNYDLGGYTVVSAAGTGGFISSGAPPSSIGVLTGSNVASTGNVVRVFKFTLANAYVLGRVSIYEVTGTAAATGNYGFYDTQGNRLLDSGALALVSSSTVISGTFTKALLLPGNYFYAYAHSSVTPTVLGIINSANQVTLLNSTNTYIATAANALSAGALPATLGSLTPAQVNMVWALFEP